MRPQLFINRLIDGNSYPGNLLSEENPKHLYQPIRLQGQHYDHESGLHYNRYRYYNPNTGRYITQDPIGLRGGMNFYSYPTKPVQWQQ